MRWRRWGRRSQHVYWCSVSDGADIGSDLFALGFEEFAFSPSGIRIREGVEYRVIAFLQERACALVALQITIAVLFAPDVGTGGHVVGILIIAQKLHASATRCRKNMQNGDRFVAVAPHRPTGLMGFIFSFGVDSCRIYKK